ncbi:hypothetical protein MCO_01459 [Bartonella sp. DB5-6]|nr:hypothetical protein MCO_01459 [Bartonella sp. DB5-6]
MVQSEVHRMVYYHVFVAFFKKQKGFLLCLIFITLFSFAAALK